MREFKGCFQCARKIFESDIFFYKPDKWFKVWMFLIGICNHKNEGKFKRGECLTTYKEISDYTGANKNQIDKFIRWAKQTTQIETRKTTRGLFINVVKYDYYQDMGNYKYIMQTTPETTTKEKRRRNGDDTIIKNDNNVKNTTKVVDTQSFGNNEVNDLIVFLKDKLGGSPDGTIKENRRFAYLLINRFKKDYPDQNPVDLIKVVIEGGLQDGFQSKNLTSFKYLFYNVQKIVQLLKGRINNPIKVKL